MTVASKTRRGIRFSRGGQAAFQPLQTFSTGFGAIGVATADFNGDGKPDVVTANQAGNNKNSISILLGNGDGTFAAPLTYATSQNPYYVVVGDSNGDGKPDVAAF